MYTSNEQQIESLKGFAAKLEDSMIKSHIQKWIAEVEPTGRITSEQLEKFLGFATHLPLELQNYPQSFIAWAKNGEVTEARELAEGTVETADLGATIDESISDVPDVDAPENEEETLHTLGKGKGVSKKISKVKGKNKK